MTNEEIKEFWTEVDNDEKLYKFHCKPTYQFQSIEFDYECTEKDIAKMVQMYKKVLDELMKVSPVQEKAPVQVSNLATDKQKEIMKKFGIKYTTTTTREEAQKLIQASIDSSR